MDISRKIKGECWAELHSLLGDEKDAPNRTSAGKSFFASVNLMGEAVNFAVQVDPRWLERRMRCSARWSVFRLRFTRGPSAWVIGSRVQCGGSGIICACPRLISNYKRLLIWKQLTGRDVRVKTRQTQCFVQSCLFNEGPTTFDIFQGVEITVQCENSFKRFIL